MAYEFLKKLFGTVKDGEQPKAMTYEELEAAIDGDKGITLVNLKDGGYVSKAKFDAKETELNGVQEQLNTANETIKGFEGQDVEGIKQKVSEWETKYNTDTQELRSQLAAQERSHAEDMFLSGYKFTSKAAKDGVLANLRGKKFQIDNGVLLGAKEYMQSLMEDEDYKGAFVTEPKGDDGNGGAAGSGGNGANGSGSGRFPRFSQGASGTQPGAAGSDGNNPLGFSFSRIRQPKNEN